MRSRRLLRRTDAAAKTAAQAKLDEVNADAGWVFKKGAIDFAGGTVVHINAGIAGLVGALLIGKRIGYGKDLMAPHSLTMSMIGASLLWVGWFGFNAGSNLEANGGAALAMTNSFVATAAAALSWMFAEWIIKGHPSVLGAMSGAVAGLVAVTPAAGYSGPMGAIVLGLVVGVVCLFFCTVVKNALGYDDSLDVFGVHCVGGIVGALGTGILVNPALGGTGIMDYTTGKIADYDFAAQMISQSLGRLHHAGVVGHRFGDPLQGRRCHRRPARQRRDRTRRPRHHRAHRARLQHVSSPGARSSRRSRPELRFGHIPGNAPTVEGLQRKLEPLSFCGRRQQASPVGRTRFNLASALSSKFRSKLRKQGVNFVLLPISSRRLIRHRHSSWRSFAGNRLNAASYRVLISFVEPVRFAMVLVRERIGIR